MANVEHLVKSTTLPNGTKCVAIGEHLRIGTTVLALPDLVELTRFYMSEIPLRTNDARFKLIDEIRESLVREEPVTGRRWVVLDALRNVSLSKWRNRSRQHA